ncbi:MAG: hypothetical protein QGH75_00760 [Pseudomonadales bacterium]|nr:hypothetical protein [Pseudomonadales bacterium]HJN51697.1 hypothetical protein [Pseudomonadales bacterium]
MNFTKFCRGFLIPIACITGSLAFSAIAYSQVLEAGEYKCWTPKQILDDPTVDSEEAAKLVSGFCQYRGRGVNGKNAFRKLDRIPQRMIKRDAPNVVSYMEPRADTSDYTITWWIEGDDPDQVHPANHVIGKQLQLDDVKHPLTRVPTVEIRAMIFSLDQTKEREIGLDITSNLVKVPGSNVGSFDEVSIDVSAGPGLLNVVGGLADPLANAIQLGFSLSSEKNYAKEQLAIHTLCPLGEFCQFEDVTDNYIMTPTGSEKARLGIRYSMQPVLGVKEGEIKLENLDFYLGLKTDDPLAPVNYIKPVNFHTYILNDGELHILSSEIRDFDSRGTHLLGKDRQSIHSRMILLISASVKDGENVNTGVFSAKPVDRSFTGAELETLDDQIGFYEVLNSFATVCFIDVMNPLRDEKICGFHFTKMNPAFVNYWIDIRIDPKKSLKYPENQVRSLKLGDMFQGKGYYQIPMLNSDKGRNSIDLRIELAKDGSGHDLRKSFKSNKIPVGIQFEFAHTSGHSDPVDVRTSSIKPLK